MKRPKTLAAPPKDATRKRNNDTTIIAHSSTQTTINPADKDIELPEGQRIRELTIVNVARGADVARSVALDSTLGNDLWFSRLLAMEHGDALKYVWEWNGWIAWRSADGRWQRDAGATPWRAARSCVRLLRTEIRRLARLDEALAEELKEAVKRFLNYNGLHAALKLAQSSPRIIATPEEWDSDPHLLNCSNGTVDLRNGNLRPHRTEDRLTKTTGVMFDPNALAPLWKKFLERILPDPAVRDYLQRAIGYAAIGNVTEHLVHVFWGGGANGKSVFCGVIERALGEYAVSVPPTLLVTTRGYGEHPTIRTLLHGARFAMASETAQDGRFDETALKALTGGDTIRARGMRENWWDFQPSHTLFLQTNHRPQVKETTFAFWRRLRLVPFTVTIPEAEQDKELTSKLQAELPGILAWIVEGAKAFQRHGLNPPAVVEAATNEYRQEEDPLLDFEECFESGGFTSCKDLHECYQAWAKAEGLDPMAPRTLTRLLRERGWTYLEHRRPRGFAVSPVPNGDLVLNADEDTL